MDTFVIIDREKKNDFFGILNKVIPAIQFTVKEEKDHQLPFFDVTVRRCDNGSLEPRVYRKPTHIGEENT